MKNKIIISTIMALSLAVGGSAFAKDNDRGNGHGHNGHSQNNGHGPDRGHDNRSDYRGKHARGHDNGRHEGRGAGPRHDFYKGSRISHEYRSRQYVVNDWRGHHLHAPPRGYQWVQTGPDYVLIAITTGIIAQIVLSN